MLVAIYRKLLVVVWHVLTKEEVDSHTQPEKVARALFKYVYQRIGIGSLPDGMSDFEHTRHNLDQLGIGDRIEEVPWGTRVIKLPPSEMKG